VGGFGGCVLGHGVSQALRTRADARARDRRTPDSEPIKGREGKGPITGRNWDSRR
jgi:hypothetical protein